MLNRLDEYEFPYEGFRIVAKRPAPDAATARSTSAIDRRTYGTVRKLIHTVTSIVAPLAELSFALLWTGDWHEKL
jgi:hypothetical protein